ncbi:MAG: calcium/sodium antiporter [Candidatus Marinimicrobia bacterium]|jgi:cation:H+ antiporter|nr:calcium/sodium antiporter [Candidatus Neomarinimicrobiota bacterium]MBT3675891.1 calcium/sodium antiporter [Candidatus Neomarinimicrobiota bacterium]MBT3763460.1 calcium/sodium antiporter [Candidatus Neomarinimicrobiota bacterium]MBT4068548.1 calcium/sodium antiporter [Candidatus Neomarinimicrobiota bacterium]MBT4271586.1 calcium/sodium antiporter [Candidatus Neomarinimicrobiota bacterium]
MSLIFLAAGTVMLFYGAEWIVKGSSGIAQRLGISPLVVGLTVVAFGTSLPELIVSIIASMEGSSSIAVGNVVGSNIANVGLVLGLSALIFPISVNYDHLKRDMFIYLCACALFILFAFDGRLSRFEGTILFISLIFYILLCIKNPHTGESKTEKPQGKTFSLVLFVIAGILLLAFGADLFVDGAIFLARFIGVSEIVIGMTVVAFGTSLPELATSAMAAFRNESAISVGNIIGSNIFNILSVLGLASIINPLDSPKEIMSFEVPLMIGYGVVMILIAKMQQPINRFISATLLGGYFIFIYLLF